MPIHVEAVLAQYQSILTDLHNRISAAQAGQTHALLFACTGALVFGLLVVAVLGRNGSVWYPPLAVPVVALYGRKYLKLRSAVLQTSRLVEFYRRGVERLTGAWPGRGDNGQQFAAPDHLYSRDLNIVGTGSLFQLLCTARTQVGRARLAAYLLDPPDVPETRLRQSAVTELAPRKDLREAVHLLGRYDFEECEWSAFEGWLAAAPATASSLKRAGMAACSALLSLLVIVLFTGALPFAQVGPPLAVLITAQVLFAVLSAGRLQVVVDRVRRFGTDIRILREGLQVMQGETFQSSKLAALAQTAGPHAIERLQRLERLVDAVYECDKEWFYGPSRLLLVPTQIAMAIESWKAENGSDLRRWADAWAEFEALNALGCYTFEHPADVFPDISEDDGVALNFNGMGHPLIPEHQCVRNDVSLGSHRRFYVVSGSNMAGKSTFLRSIGLNAVLAVIGAPIRAISGTLSSFSVGASIATGDSLAEGKSRFMSEVDRLRAIVQCSSGRKPVLFLMDEIFSGTNSTDRRIAAEIVLRRLVQAGAVGVLSTHDLALAEIAGITALKGENVHMATTSAGEPLSFDYLIKRGVCRQSNALAIVKLAGISAA